MDQRPVSTIDRDLVKRIAHLARLSVTDDECEMYSQQLTTILGHLNMLQEADVDGVPPAHDLQPEGTPLRADDLDTSLPRDEVMALAPHHADGYVKVASVMAAAARTTAREHQR